MLGVVQPFGIDRLKGMDFAWVLIYSVGGSIAGISLSLYVLPLCFRSFFAPSRLTIGRHILANLLSGFFTAVCVGVGGMLCIHFYYHTSFDKLVGNFIGLFTAVLFIFPIPSIILAVWTHSRMLSARLQEAQEMNERLERKAQHDQPTTGTPVVILSGSTKDSMELPVESLLYLEAFGNYIKVFYRENGKVKQKLLRTTIKQMEESLQSYPAIVRCHRAFLVNSTNVLCVKGNSQGYHLRFADTDEEVPVSRAYAKAIQQSVGN